MARARRYLLPREREASAFPASFGSTCGFGEGTFQGRQIFDALQDGFTISVSAAFLFGCLELLQEFPRTLFTQLFQGGSGQATLVRRTG